MSAFHHRIGILGIAWLIIAPLQFDSALAKDWQMVRTEHFVVMGDAGGKELERQAQDLEIFHSFLVKLLPQANHSIDRPIRVIAFSGERSIRPFLPEFKGKPKAASGYFVNGSPPYLVTSPERAPRRGWRTESIALHEYVHYFFSRNFDYLPLWLNEGLADVFATFNCSEDGTTAEMGQPLDDRLYVLKRVPMLPLDTLFSVEFDSPHYNRPDRAGLFYSQSWAVAHLLLFSPDFKQSFQRLVDMLSAGFDPAGAFRDVYARDLKEMEKAVNRHVRASSIPYSRYLLNSVLDPPKVDPPVQLSPEETAYHQAVLLARLDKEDEAEKRILRVLKTAPGDGAALTCLAGLRLRSGDRDEAAELLDRAAQADSDDFELEMRTAELWYLLFRPEQALRHLERALVLDPRAQQPYRNMGLIHLRQGRDQAAAEAFSHLDDKLPSNQRLHFNRSVILLERHRGEDASRDAAIFIRRHRHHDNDSAYALLFIFLGNLLEGTPDKAFEVLDTYAEWEPSEDWPKPVFEYFRGELSDSDLLKAARDNDQKTEAHAYVGLKLAYTGDAQGSLPYLEWVRKNGNPLFSEYELAIAELERMEHPTE